MAGIDFVQKVDTTRNGVLGQAQSAILLSIAPLHPFGKGNLTEDGIQWSDEVTTTGAEWIIVEGVLISVGATLDIIEIEFGLTLALKSTGATKDAKFKWQAKNDDGDWVDLHTEITYPADASAYKEYTVSGRMATSGDLDKLPIYITAMVQREDATEDVVAKVKNSSYVLLITEPE